MGLLLLCFLGNLKKINKKSKMYLRILQYLSKFKESVNFWISSLNRLKKSNTIGYSKKYIENFKIDIPTQIYTQKNFFL